VRLLPDREIPPGIEITAEMLRLQAFKIEQKEVGSAALRPGDTAAPTPISEFAAKVFEPQFVPKGQRRFGGFDQKIIAMYAQGMTVREIQRFLEEQYFCRDLAAPFSPSSQRQRS
jgi:mutator family transposase